MDRIIETLVVQSPGAVAVIVVVVFFLKYLRESEIQRGDTLRKIGAECHSVQERAISALEKNTEALGRNSEVLDRLEAKLGDDRSNTQ